MSEPHDARAAAALGGALEHLSGVFEDLDRAIGELPEGLEADAAIQARAELTAIAKRLGNLRVLVQAETKRREGASAP